MMRRSPEKIEKTHYDVLVIGGGINGIAVAYESALRGLKTCLIEARDFMSGSSSNSLKIIHGGLRYLQQADFQRIRESSHERRALLKIAPHLIHPLKCIMPTESIWKLRSLPGLFAAIVMNSFISIDRNRGLPPDKRIPMGEILFKNGLIKLLGKGFDKPQVTGAAVWFDGIALNSERLGIAFIHSGIKNGLDAINHCPVTGVKKDKQKIFGLVVKDLLNSREFEISGDFIINVTGAWTNGLSKLLTNVPGNYFTPVRSMNFIIRRELFPGGQAVGLFKGGRAFFFVPWRGYWMVGTDEGLWEGEPDSLEIKEKDMESFLSKINAVYPGEPIKRGEICFVHKGLLPAKTGKSGQPVKPEEKYRFHDHSDEGVENMLSLFPVKYTTARDVAQNALDYYFQKTGRPFRPSLSSELPLEGGEMDCFSSFYERTSEELSRTTTLKEKCIRHLLYTHGSSYKKILEPCLAYPKLLLPVPGSDEVMAAEIEYAVREEMACTLGDVILRRTDLGTLEKPSAETLNFCASMMADMLSWSKEKINSEISDLNRFYI